MDVATLFAIAPPHVAMSIPIYLYLKSKSDKKTIDASVQKSDLALSELAKHKEECNEIRKEVLMEKIVNLDNNFSDFRKEVRAGLAENRDQNLAIMGLAQKLLK